MEIAINYDYKPDVVKGLFDIEKLARLVLTAEEQPDNVEVSISFVDNERIHELNREYRDIDRPTDVLSFECDGFDDDFDADFGAEECFELGDIVIAVDVAQSQAPEYGLTFAEETSLLVTHGLLHLCGYDHMQDDEAVEMETRETEILSSFWGRPFKRSAIEA